MNEMEEGELSEGQFEDLYEPREPVAIEPKAKTTAPPTAPAADRNLPGSTFDSAADTPDGGFYTEDDSQNKTRASTKKAAKSQQPQFSRERSGSYSPYLSPREIQGDSTPQGRVQSPKAVPKPAAASLPGFHIQQKPSVQVPGLGQQGQNGPSAANGSANAKPSQPKSQTANGAKPAAAPTPPFQSLAEAKKEAQKAILRLWPMGVKFQHYVDEGIDEQVVKRLFTDLHLDMSTGKPADSVAQPAKGEAKSTEPQKSVTAVSSPTTARQPLAQTSAAAKPAATGEESRKDRIARLLAEKKAKGPAAAPASTAAPASVSISVPVVPPPARTPSIPAPPPAPVLPVSATVPAAAQVTQTSVVSGTPVSTTPVPTTPATMTNGKRPKTKEEINALLRQKMEALQRGPVEKPDVNTSVPGSSVASSTTSAAVTVPVGTPTGPSSTIVSAAPRGAPTGPASLTPTYPFAGVPTGPKAVRSSLPPTVPTGPRASITPTASAVIPVSLPATVQQPSPGQQAQQDGGSIPGLYLSTAPPVINTRKRPVAADSFGGAPSKRPFGQERSDSSLVIDISDDEDMDVEMEIESPTEAPVSLARAHSAGAKTLPFAKHPPLTDTLQRQTSSPAPSTQTPPTGLTKQELAAKQAASERTIEELRRKIAEAEAKRKAKQASASGAQTPMSQPIVSSDDKGSASSVANDVRGSSVSALDKTNGPSAQLIAEAVAAETSRSSEAVQPATVLTASSANKSVDVPAAPVEAVPSAKKSRKSLSKAERLRQLQEEMARLQAEEDDEASDDDADKVTENADAEPAEIIRTQEQVQEATVEKQTSVEVQQSTEESLVQPLDAESENPAALSEALPEQDISETTEEGEIDDDAEDGEIAETPKSAMPDAVQSRDAQIAVGQADTSMEDAAEDSVADITADPTNVPDPVVANKAYTLKCPWPRCNKTFNAKKRGMKKHMLR